MVSRLLDLLGRYHLNEEPVVGTFDILETRADNMLLRIEVADLKCKLNTANSHARTLIGGIETWTPIVTSSVGHLTGGKSVSMEVVGVGPDGCVLITSSLAPSSVPLGRLNLGTRVMTAGQPEEILGQMRAPILPRGWVTVSEPGRIFLAKC